MTRALVLALVVPSIAFAGDAALLPQPSFEQPAPARFIPPPAAVVVAEDRPLYARWYVWTGVGATVTAAVIAVVVGVKLGDTRQLKKSDFQCSPCDGYTNPPPDP